LREEYSIDSISENFSKNILIKIVNIYNENIEDIAEIDTFLYDLKLR
jgi:hypothetical protein